MKSIFSLVFLFSVVSYTYSQETQTIETEIKLPVLADMVKNNSHIENKKETKNQDDFILSDISQKKILREKDKVVVDSVKNKNIRAQDKY